MSYFAPLRQTTPSLASKTHHRSLRWIISVAQKLTVCWQRLGKKGARPCGLLWVLLVWAKEGKVYFICPVAATKGGLGWGWCWCWFCWGGGYMPAHGSGRCRSCFTGNFSQCGTAVFMKAQADGRAKQLGTCGKVQGWWNISHSYLPHSPNSWGAQVRLALHSIAGTL